MPWTMPHRVLQLVATMIVLAAVTAFALGVVNAPNRGRLPGEKVAPAATAAAVAAAIEATDATPLSNERIEGPPPPTPEELAAKAKAEEEAKAKAEAEARAAEEAERAALANAPVITVPRLPSLPRDTTASQQTLGGPPAPDEPPH